MPSNFALIVRRAARVPVDDENLKHDVRLNAAPFAAHRPFHKQIMNWKMRQAS